MEQGGKVTMHGAFRVLVSASLVGVLRAAGLQTPSPELLIRGRNWGEALTGVTIHRASWSDNAMQLYPLSKGFGISTILGHVSRTPGVWAHMPCRISPENGKVGPFSPQNGQILRRKRLFIDAVDFVFCCHNWKAC